MNHPAGMTFALPSSSHETIITTASGYFLEIASSMELLIMPIFPRYTGRLKKMTARLAAIGKERG